MKKSHLIFFLLLFFNAKIHAVNLSAQGSGDVLIYPYYTVNNDLNTLISLTNTAAEPKALKLRFLEGLNGTETLVLNLYLGGNDVWSAAIGTDGEGAALVTADNSCIANQPSSTNDVSKTYAFDNARFASDPGSNAESRERDGYIEVIEMGTVFNTSVFATLNPPRFECDAVQMAWDESGIWDVNPGNGIEPPSGGLYGHALLIDVTNGLSFPYKATALQGFLEDNTQAHAAPESVTPNLTAAANSSSILWQGKTYASEWDNGIDAVTAVLMSDQVSNSYILEDSINAQTELVVTFPTKRFYVDPQNTGDRDPFDSTFDSEIGSCETYLYDRYDTEQMVIPDISANPVGDPQTLCFAANVLKPILTADFTLPFPEYQPDTSILGAETPYPVPVFENGFMRIRSFANESRLTDNQNNYTYFGIPVLGFSVQKYQNANAQPNVLAEYGNVIEHTHSKSILDLNTRQ